MVGLKTVLPTSFSDTTMAKLRDDPVLPDSGALLLIDPSNLSGTWPSGVPVSAATVPNIAQTQAVALEGVSASSTLVSVATVGLGAGGAATTLGKVERTPKGGLHVIVTQDNTKVIDNTGNSAYYSLNMPIALKNYLATNRAHTFYMSQWFRVTRSYKVGAQSTWRAAITNPASSTGKWMMQIPNTGNAVGNGGSSSGNGGALVGSGTGGIQRASLSGTDFANSGAPTDGSGVLGYIFATGNIGGVNNYQTAASASPSGVLYRAYLEDLTVSGRTYAQVDALDLQEFTNAFAAGGRYNGDTIPTDPTTIP